ncbi:MAG: hypothetical protein AUI47_08925 [Acidobacteria bacterium 13_1_40CM_2_68_5]|nr:MAG: hypothetical protein AUI47_08925 [Acidobacteria bacterium 13_1_40CM_2_68_5]
MTAAAMTERIAEASPRVKARAAGVFWLMTILTSTFAAIVGGRLVVSGDAAATAANILAQEALFRLGTAANLIATACYVAATLLVFELLKPVSRSVSLLAAFFSLVGCAVGALSSLFDSALFVLLRGAQYLSVFTGEQLQALALMFLKVGGQVGNIGLVFFGLHCLLIGYLILRSTFLPRILGAVIGVNVPKWEEKAGAWRDGGA